LTRLGYGRKAELGLAQEGEGRRGFSHAFSNVGVSAICALLAAASGLDPVLLWLAAIGSLATATADTTGSEIGQLYGRRAFLPVTLARVPVGTEGAISIEGTVAGFFGGLAAAAVGGGLLHARLAGEGTPAPSPFLIIGVVAIAAFLGSWIESVVGAGIASGPEAFQRCTELLQHDGRRPPGCVARKPGSLSRRTYPRRPPGIA